MCSTSTRRLLERAARVNADYVEEFTDGEVKGQTGSLTALPIIETQAGEVSSFVPANVISITDGQIYLELDRFNSGIRPAMSPGISVSRVGGSAQVPFIKKISGGIKLALAQYRELAAFSQFASDLDEVTRRQLDHGARVEELMKQMQYAPMTVADMGVVLFAASEGYLVDVPVDRVLDFETRSVGLHERRTRGVDGRGHRLRRSQRRDRRIHEGGARQVPGQPQLPVRKLHDVDRRLEYDP